MKRNNLGFTLLEVMVALAIFAVSALVILQQSSLSVSQQTELEEKTFALWVAENQIDRLRLTHQWPDTGTSESEATIPQRNWLVQQEITQTANPSLRKIIVTVSKRDADDPLVTLQGFTGEH